jgi:hypothetical protein
MPRTQQHTISFMSQPCITCVPWLFSATQSWYTGQATCHTSQPERKKKERDLTRRARGAMQHNTDCTPACICIQSRAQIPKAWEKNDQPTQQMPRPVLQPRRATGVVRTSKPQIQYLLCQGLFITSKTSLLIRAFFYIGVILRKRSKSSCPHLTEGLCVIKMRPERRQAEKEVVVSPHSRLARRPNPCIMCANRSALECVSCVFLGSAAWVASRAAEIETCAESL